MKIALISDVHANLPALDAVLQHLEGDPTIDATYHLGDLVGYAPWPNETVERVRTWRGGIPGIAGNYDSTVGHVYKHCGCKYEDPVQEQQSHESFAWTLAHVTPATSAYLKTLPFRLDIRPTGGHSAAPTLALIHGSPTLNTVYFTADRSDAFCSQMAERAGLRSGDVLAFGHTHAPWHRQVDGIHFVNTGSVGRPKDGDWRAGYTVIDFSTEIVVEHRRTPYDVEQTAQAIEASDLPHAFADFLRAGGKPLTTTSS
jgi:predicted phosphodiesterase